MRIVLTGGGTGGHVYPALAIAEGLRCIEANIDIHFLGTASGFESKAVPLAGENFRVISSGGIVGKSFVDRVAGIFRAGLGVLESWRILRELKPDVVVGTGGFVMAPVLLAARMMRIPFVIQEQNSYPGLTTRKFARYAKAVCVAYSQAADHLPGANVIVTGNPLRKAIVESAQNKTSSKIESPPRILVTGGSLGARSINSAVSSVISELCDIAQVTWQFGKSGVPESVDKLLLSNLTASGALNAAPFFEDMPSRYSNTDLVICRAGAMTLSELSVYGLPALLIPFPHAAHDHQTANAIVLEESGAASIIQDQSLTGEALLLLCRELLNNSSVLGEMSLAMRQLARPNAAYEIADIVRNSATQ